MARITGPARGPSVRSFSCHCLTRFIVVFIFFGLIATLGSSYVQHRSLPATAWVAAVATGVRAVAILVVNNLRDVPTDAIAGKRLD